jgi:tetratricopeptide (TPR) repeat protein
LSRLNNDAKRTWQTLETIEIVRDPGTGLRGEIWRCTILLWLTQNSKRRAALFLKRAYAYYWTGGYEQAELLEKALTDCNAAIQLAPKNADAYLARGFVKANMGSTSGSLCKEIAGKEALDDFDKAISLEPLNAKLYSFRAVFCYAWRGSLEPDWDKSLANINKAIELDSLNAQYFMQRGIFPNVATSISDLNEAIRLDPNNYTQTAWCYSRLAFIYNNRVGNEANDDKSAASYYTQAIRTAQLTKKKGLIAHSFYNRAKFYDRKGELLSAIADYTEVLAIGKDYWHYGDSLQARVLAYQNVGDYRSAIADYDRMINHEGATYSSTASSRMLRAHAFAKKGDLNRAIQDCDTCLRKIESLERYEKLKAAAFAHYVKGFAYSLRGDLERAIADYSEALHLKPNFATALIQRGHLHEKRGDLQLALADFDAVCAFPKKQVYLGGRHYTLVPDAFESPFSDRVKQGTAIAIGCPDANEARERVKAALERQTAYQ